MPAMARTFRPRRRPRPALAARHRPAPGLLPRLPHRCPLRARPPDTRPGAAASVSAAAATSSNTGTPWLDIGNHLATGSDSAIGSGAVGLRRGLGSRRGRSRPRTAPPRCRRGTRRRGMHRYRAAGRPTPPPSLRRREARRSSGPRRVQGQPRMRRSPSCRRGHAVGRSRRGSSGASSGCGWMAAAASFCLELRFRLDLRLDSWSQPPRPRPGARRCRNGRPWCVCLRRIRSSGATPRSWAGR